MPALPDVTGAAVGASPSPRLPILVSVPPAERLAGDPVTATVSTVQPLGCGRPAGRRPSGEGTGSGPAWLRRGGIVLAAGRTRHPWACLLLLRRGRGTGAQSPGTGRPLLPAQVEPALGPGWSPEALRPAAPTLRAGTRAQGTRGSDPLPRLGEGKRCWEAGWAPGLPAQPWRACERPRERSCQGRGWPWAQTMPCLCPAAKPPPRCDRSPAPGRPALSDIGRRQQPPGDPEHVAARSPARPALLVPGAGPERHPRRPGRLR